MEKMTLHMNESSTIKDIQTDFSTEYPFLKMDFLKIIRDRLGWITGTEKMLPGEKMLPYYRNTVKMKLSIDGDKTVNGLISDIEESLNMKVRVLRRSGNVWIETSLTMDWTLEQQNSEGKFLSGLH
jgi:hypothetical protein